MTLSGMKPSWKNLKGGGAKTPVGEMVGLFSGWRTEPSQYGTNVILEFSQCQMLRLDAPYPYAEWALSVKFSESANSGWGILGKSIADGLDIDIELMDIDLLSGRWCHMLREDNHSFGINKNVDPPVEMTGSVWKLIEFVQPGQPVTAVVAAPVPVAAPAPVVAPVAVMAPVAVPAPVAVATTPVTAAIPVVAGAAPAAVAVASVPAPVAAPTPTQGVVLSDDPQTRALQMLHGKDLSTFFQTAIPDQVIRIDGSLIQSITANAYVPAQVAAGKAVHNADGTYSVVGM